MVFKDLQRDGKYSWLGQVVHISETVQTSDDTGESWKIQAPPRAFQLTLTLSKVNKTGQSTKVISLWSLIKGNVLGSTSQLGNRYLKNYYFVSCLSFFGIYYQLLGFKVLEPGSSSS